MKLGDVLELHRGYDLPKGQRIDGEVPVISSSGVSGSHNVAKCDGANVVTGRYGTIGEVFFHEGPCWPLNTTLYVSDFKGNDERYIYYLLKYALGTLMRGDGSDKSTVPGVDRNVLHMMDVPFEPDLARQKELVSLLFAIDAKIETNAKAIAELDSLARTVYEHAFCSSKNWQRGALSDMAEQIRKSVNPGAEPDSTFEHYSIPDYDDAHYPSFVKGFEILSQKSVVQKGDVLISKLNPQFPRLWVPYCFSERAICSTEFVVLRPKHGFSQSLIWATLNSNRFNAFAISNATSSTGSRKRIDPDVILAYETLIPREADADELSTSLNSLLNSMVELEIESHDLAALRDYLLPMLMNGQVTIDD